MVPVAIGHVTNVLRGGMAGFARTATWESHHDGHSSTISVSVVKAAGAVGHAILRMVHCVVTFASLWHALAWSTNGAATKSGAHELAGKRCDQPHSRTTIDNVICQSFSYFDEPHGLQ